MEQGHVEHQNEMGGGRVVKPNRASRLANSRKPGSKERIMYDSGESNTDTPSAAVSYTTEEAILSRGQF